MYEIRENKDNTVDVFYDSKFIKKFYPNFNLDESAKLLAKFNNIIGRDGNYLHSKWALNEVFIFPAIQNWLYWDYFVGLIAYKDLHEFLRNKKFRISVPSFYVNGRLQRMQNLLYKKKR